MKLKEVLDKTIKFFKDKGIETARLDAELLFAKALSLSRIDLYLKYDQPVSENELNICRDYVRRRAQGEPVAYITNSRGFFGYDFYVNSCVLIPRPETELLVETILEWTKKNPKESGYDLIDLGTGSGCIGLTLAKKLANSRATLVDSSAGAIEVAQKNAAQLKVEEHCAFVIESVGASVFKNKKFDIIVSNPPYISELDESIQQNVKKYEPHQALFAPEAGLSFLREWSSLGAKHLSRPAILAFEMGFDQGKVMKDHFQSLQIFDEVFIVKDLAGLDRHIVGVVHG
ncbi:MAG: release factor glutamine methyltransferase [Oligoflexia bacterium]|nr:MAG: release factor glutamine methyltransferase [Oligoflexia bacterium]